MSQETKKMDKCKSNITAKVTERDKIKNTDAQKVRLMKKLVPNKDVQILCTKQATSS